MERRPIILTGFMGSGKSSVGKVLSRLLEVPLIDLDADIVAAAGCSITEIFSRDGEELFRTLESERLALLLSKGGKCVVATGGGVVISGENRRIMRACGIIVNLNVSLHEVLRRLERSNDRPLLAGEDGPLRATRLMAEREQFYADADIRIDTDGKSVEDVAREILLSLKGYLRGVAVR